MSLDILELRSGAARLRVAPRLGSRITACELVDAEGVARAVLHPYPEGHADLDNWGKGGLYPLVPYSGRVRNAQMLHEGREVSLQPHAGSPHTLHGIAQRRPWQLVAQGAEHARMVYRHLPDAHWPWSFESEMAVRLESSQVEVCITLRNTADSAMPGGIGLHPYLLHDTGEVMRYLADEPWPFDTDYLSLPQPAHPGTVQAQEVTPGRFQGGEVTLFHAVWQGALQVIDRHSGRPRVEMRASGALDQLLLHRPPNTPYACVEPVSHLADGFNLAARGQAGTGTRLLAPGECLEGEMVIALPGA